MVNGKTTKKDRERRRITTGIGAAFAIAAMLVLVVTVGVLSTSLSGSVVQGQLTTTDVLWSSETDSDISTDNPPIVTQRFCTSNTETLSGDFLSSATHGQGNGFTTLHSDIINGCSIDHSVALQVVYTLTGAELSALNPRAIGIGFSEDSAPFQEMNFSWGLFAPANPAGTLDLVLIQLPFFKVINETREWFVEFGLPALSFLTFFPTFYLVIWLTSSGDHFPPAGTTWNIDTTIYGQNSTSTVAVAFTDMFTTSEILLAAMLVTGLLGLVAAVLIWPTSTTQDMNNIFRRGGRS